jgi:hypothetical protein
MGGAYAYTLYAFGTKPWSKKWNISLFLLRFIGITLIAYLFLEPFLSARSTQSEKLNIIFLWDDSQSIGSSLNEEQQNQIWRNVTDVADRLKVEKDVNLDIINLSGEIISSFDSVEQNAPLSPLDPALKSISETYNNQLISEVVLFSDGIFNRGISPEYFAYPFPVSTVGIGDTIEKRDVELRDLRYNKVSYQGNKFPIVAEVVQNGWQGKSTSIELYRNDLLVERKPLEFNTDNSVKEIEFLIEAKEKGFQSYAVKIVPFEEEFNKNNNQKNAFINVVEGKKKILLLARAPHPDIKALQQAITGNENYELNLTVAGIHEYKEDDYDLVILFHLPDDENTFRKEIDELADQKKAFWFITGPGTSVSQLNKYNQSVEVASLDDTDEASIYINSNFNNFELIGEQGRNLQSLPPVDVPFSENQINARSETLLYKQIGSVKTEQSIFIFYAEEEVRQATLLMEGFWKWRLVEYLNTESFEFFDEWVIKTIRYLTSKNDKDQFKLYPEKEEFSNSEEIKFQVELYNQVYDKIYGLPVNLQLRNENDSAFTFQFTPDRVQPDFIIGTLSAGIYEYSGQTEISGKRYLASGQFVVSNFAIELQNLVADFEMLKRVAIKNEGKYFEAQAMDSLYNYLAAREYPKIVTGNLEKKPLTENYWLFGVIFLIFFSEWFIRRYFGSY